MRAHFSQITFLTPLAFSSQANPAKSQWQHHVHHARASRERFHRAALQGGHPSLQVGHIGDTCPSLLASGQGKMALDVLVSASAWGTSVRHRTNLNFSRLQPFIPHSVQTTQEFRTAHLGWVTLWQHCSTDCYGQKHWQDWDDSALLLLESALSAFCTDPASVFAPHLHAAHVSLFFPLLSKLPPPSVSCWIRAELLARLWGVEEGGDFCESQSVSQQRREGRGFALGFTFCCSFHFCWVRAPWSSPGSEITSAGEWEVGGRKERDLSSLTTP